MIEPHFTRGGQCDGRQEQGRRQIGEVAEVAEHEYAGRIRLSAGHPLAATPSVAPADLAGDTWIRAHDGSAADHVAAGRGVTLTHELTVIVSRADVVTRPPAGETGVRHIRVTHPPGR